MRYYDKHNQRLIYFQRASSPEFWDGHWETRRGKTRSLASIQRTEVSKVTCKYLKPNDGFILEGGCGNGQHVAALVNNGYFCIGLDYASQTLNTIKAKNTTFNLSLGDVRQLGFQDASFAGYWSLGVIEHFWDGYGDIAKEMARVIKPGGYLFLTFPYMSPLRKLKSSLGLYLECTSEKSDLDFYQFALNHKQVIADFEKLGFIIQTKKPRDGIKGLKSEVPKLRPGLQKLYDYRGKSVFIRGFRFLLSNVCSLFAGHYILVVFIRQKG